jgi:hypothetical protein
MNADLQPVQVWCIRRLLLMAPGSPCGSGLDRDSSDYRSSGLTLVFAFSADHHGFGYDLPEFAPHDCRDIVAAPNSVPVLQRPYFRVSIIVFVWRMRHLHRKDLLVVLLSRR